jgi:diguanylate cyclase (GGDEF)-like protein/PAS domain S-box-containing protein
MLKIEIRPMNLKMLIKNIKIVIPIWTVFIVFALSIFFIFIPSLKNNLIDQKREMINKLTDSAVSLLFEYNEMVLTGELKLEEAKARALNQIRSLRYGSEGKDYFWINDMHPFMLMHPYRSDLEGRDLTLFKDKKGNYPFIAMIEKVMNSGGGFVNYYWQWKDEPHKIVPKISYVKGFKPWGWVVGTGIYTEDVHSEIKNVLNDLNKITISILFFILGLSVYMTWQTIKIRNRKRLIEKRLRESRERMKFALKGADMGMWDYTIQSGEWFLDERSVELLGACPHNFSEMELLIHPEDVKPYNDAWAEVAEGRKPFYIFEYRLNNSQGQYKWLMDKGKIIEWDSNGEPIRATGTMQDITVRKIAEKKLQETAERLELSLKGANLGTWEYFGKTDTYTFNERAIEILGQDIKNESEWASILHPDDLKRMLDYEDKFRSSEFKGNFLQSEYRIITKEGDIKWLFDHGKSFAWDKNGKIIRSSGIIQDITERKKYQIELKAMALHDPLTELPNRRLFFESLSMILKLSQRNNKMFAILYLDLDGFKNVNDSFGHEAGDELLREVSGLLKGVCRKTDTIARLGGDEFAIIIGQLKSEKGAGEIAKKIITAFTKNFQLTACRVHVTASIGISLFPTNSGNLEELVQQADKAMYRSKRQGKNTYTFFCADNEIVKN